MRLHENIFANGYKTKVPVAAQGSYRPKEPFSKAALKPFVACSIKSLSPKTRSRVEVPLFFASGLAVVVVLPNSFHECRSSVWEQE